jgi:hypothetical protein
MRLKQRLIVLPDGLDIVTSAEHWADAPQRAASGCLLGDLKERYLITHANGTVEANSLDTCRLHLGHLTHVLGEGFP